LEFDALLFKFGFCFFSEKEIQVCVYYFFLDKNFGEYNYEKLVETLLTDETGLCNKIFGPHHPTHTYVYKNIYLLNVVHATKNLML